MKVLLTTPLYPPNNSGLSNAVQQQALGLGLRGFDVTVATGGQKRGRREDGISGAKIEEFCVSGAQSWLQPIKGDVDSYISFLRESHFDSVIMHAWQNWATDIAIRYANDFQGRKYLFSHCISTNLFFRRQPVRSAIRYLLWRPYWWALSKKIRNLDGVIFLADQGVDSRFSDLKVARNTGAKIHIVPNCVSPAAVKLLANPVVPNAERFQLISIGSYHWLKGFEFVLHAYANSSAKNIRPLKLFGQQHTRFSEKLYSLAERLGLDRACVSFHEGVQGEALAAEYAKSFLFVSGSHTECQPLVLLDAMAAGTPFVARSVGCIASLPGGLVVRSAGEAATQIDKFITDPDLWQNLSTRGRQAATNTYHPNQTSRLLVNALQEQQTMCTE